MVSTAAFHARVRGSVPGLGGLKETKMFLPHPRVKVSIVGSLRDREVACSTSDRQGSNFESCVWRTVSSHYPQEVLLAQFSLYVHKGGLKPDSFYFFFRRKLLAVMKDRILQQQVKNTPLDINTFLKEDLSVALTSATSQQQQQGFTSALRRQDPSGRQPLLSMTGHEG